MKHKRKILIGCILVCCMMVLVTPRFHAATKASVAGIVTTQSTGLNVRKEASANSNRLTVLPKGSYVTLLERRGDWWYVEYGKGKYGYCAAQYITEENTCLAGFVNTQQTGLNVRKGPGAQYGVDAVLSKGTIFVILSEHGAWSRILYNGVKTGYVSSDYVGTYGQVYSKISLAVPSYKQWDSRWASYPIGQEGGTIRTIGCTLTGIAMMESYRTGTAITPDMQAKKLSFTSGGALYWPSNFTRVSVNDRAACLEQIYEILQSGRPVLVGGKTYKGSHHWVVVTGYKGGTGTLSAWDFTINDPGSATAATLGDHFSNCSSIHSMAYYRG